MPPWSAEQVHSQGRGSYAGTFHVADSGTCLEVA